MSFQVSQFIKNNDKSIPIEIEDVSFKVGSDIIEESQKLKYAVEISKQGYDVTIIDIEDVIENVWKKYGELFKYRVK